MGATSDPATVVTHGAFEGYLPEAIIGAMREAIRILGGCIGNARSKATGRESEPKLEILLGLSLLAFSEAQALLMLCSAGFERAARVHVRSLFEYDTRAVLMLSDAKKAADFSNAALAEIDRFGGLLGASQNDIDGMKATYLGQLQPPATSLKEKMVVGDMRSIVQAQSGDKVYGVMYAQMSLVSHGSILALDEVSRALENVGSQFQDALTRDGSGARYLVCGALFCASLARKLVEHLHMDAIEQLEALTNKLTALQASL